MAMPFILFVVRSTTAQTLYEEAHNKRADEPTGTFSSGDGFYLCLSGWWALFRIRIRSPRSRGYRSSLLGCGQLSTT